MQMARFNFKSTTLENCILYTINSIEMTFYYQEHKIYLYLIQKIIFLTANCSNTKRRWPPWTKVYIMYTFTFTVGKKLTLFSVNCAMYLMSVFIVKLFPYMSWVKMPFSSKGITFLLWSLESCQCDLYR